MLSCRGCGRGRDARQQLEQFRAAVVIDHVYARAAEVGGSHRLSVKAGQRRVAEQYREGGGCPRRDCLLQPHKDKPGKRNLARIVERVRHVGR
nr:hypothetical protein [Bacteroides acidifaciens]